MNDSVVVTGVGVIHVDMPTPTHMSMLVLLVLVVFMVILSVLLVLVVMLVALVSVYALLLECQLWWCRHICRCRCKC